MGTTMMKTVVLLSGGVDSAVLLADRLQQGDEVQCLSFDYGQRHSHYELKAACRLADRYGCRRQVVCLPAILFGESALTIGSVSVPPRGLPPVHPAQTVTVVPGRNLVFIACAVAFAKSNGYDAVTIACHHDDDAVYPDCRHDFLNALSVASKVAYGVSVLSPYLSMAKSEIVALGRSLSVPFDMTYSCYVGDKEPCGQCGACLSRKAVGL